MASQSALTLAHQLRGAPIFRVTVEQQAETLEHVLINTILAWRGVGCDPKVTACREAAKRISREAAPGFWEERRAAAERVVAIVLDARMTEAQMRAATAFAKRPEGQALVTALLAADSLETLPPEMQARVMKAMRASAGLGTTALSERFFDETKSLPRGTLHAPPPPRPSAPRNP